MLPSVPEGKKVVLCFPDKIHVLDQLHLGMRFSAVGHEFNVNDSTISMD